MANTIAIRSTAGSGMDLQNSTYWATEQDVGPPNIERRTQSGCGTNGAVTVSRKMVDWDIPMTVLVFGADGNARGDNRDTLIRELESAVAYETNHTDSTAYDGLPRYYIRTVDNQAPTDLWQIMDYRMGFSRRRDDNKFMTLNLTLICWPGQKIPADLDLTGLTVTPVMGGIGRAILGGDGFPIHLGGL